LVSDIGDNSEPIGQSGLNGGRLALVTRLNLTFYKNIILVSFTADYYLILVAEFGNAADYFFASTGCKQDAFDFGNVIGPAYDASFQ
jgi:hypothetical protein